MKIAAVVILYNPTSDVLTNIETYKNYVDYVICVDNTNNDNFKTYCSDYTYIPLYENKGIATALNIGVKKAEFYACDSVLTMDQDSSFANNIIGIYRTYLKSLSKDVKMLVPSYIFSRAKNVEKDQFITFAMQSAALIEISVFHEIGYFEEKLFIDVVDYEFCLRLISRKYRILQIAKAKLNHSPAHTKDFSVFGFKFAYGYDSCVRYYYQARNLLYVGCLYRQPYLFFFLIYKFLKIVFLFENKFQYLKFFLRGIFDVFRNKFGKCDLVY